LGCQRYLLTKSLRVSMHCNQRKLFKFAIKALVTAAILLGIAGLSIITLIGWSEFSRTRYLERLIKETQVPRGLLALGSYPIASIFEPSEEKICVFHSYKGGLREEKMGPAQRQALEDLELPSEDGTWYLIAFRGDDITRVLLIDESTTVKLVSQSECFEPITSGLFLVQKQSSESPSIPTVKFVLKE